MQNNLTSNSKQIQITPSYNVLKLDFSYILTIKYLFYFIEDDDYTVYMCDIYRDAWKDDKSERWIVGKNMKSPLFCTGNPFWQPKPFQPICNKNWPIRIEFNDGSKYKNGTLKTCTVNLADSKNSSSTQTCMKTVLNGFGEVKKLDWVVYITAGFNSRILWYHDFSEALIKR